MKRLYIKSINFFYLLKQFLCSNTIKIILLFSLISFKSIGQDTILDRSGETHVVKIIEIDTSVIKYKSYDKIDSPVYLIKKSDVTKIIYSSGLKEFFEIKYDSNFFLKQPGPFWFELGQKDAKRYYRGYGAAATASWLSVLIFPFSPVIPIATSLTAPLEKNLGYPNLELMKNKYYNLGYRKKAKNIKAGKVWMNFGICIGVTTAFSLFIASQI